MTKGIPHPPCPLDPDGVHHPTKKSALEVTCPCGAVGIFLNFDTIPGHPLADRGDLFTSDTQMMSLIENGMQAPKELRDAIAARLRAARRTGSA